MYKEKMEQRKNCYRIESLNTQVAGGRGRAGRRATPEQTKREMNLLRLSVNRLMTFLSEPMPLEDFPHNCLRTSSSLVPTVFSRHA